MAQNLGYPSMPHTSPTVPGQQHVDIPGVVHGLPIPNDPIAQLGALAIGGAARQEIRDLKGR